MRADGKRKEKIFRPGVKFGVRAEFWGNFGVRARDPGLWRGQSNFYLGFCFIKRDIILIFFQQINKNLTIKRKITEI
jgi:hypothetical protein